VRGILKECRASTPSFVHYWYLNVLFEETWNLVNGSGKKISVSVLSTMGREDALGNVAKFEPSLDILSATISVLQALEFHINNVPFVRASSMFQMLDPGLCGVSEERINQVVTDSALGQLLMDSITAFFFSVVLGGPMTSS